MLGGNNKVTLAIKHISTTRYLDTERYRKSAIPNMHNLLNEDPIKNQESFQLGKDNDWTICEKTTENNI